MARIVGISNVKLSLIENDRIGCPEKIQKKILELLNQKEEIANE